MTYFDLLVCNMERLLEPAAAHRTAAGVTYGNGECGISCPLTVPEDTTFVTLPITWSVVYEPLNVFVLLTDSVMVVMFRAYSAPSVSNTRLMYWT
jgi:hypothetical protein